MFLNIMAAFAAISSGLIAFRERPDNGQKDIKVRRAPVAPERVANAGNGTPNINKSQAQTR